MFAVTFIDKHVSGHAPNQCGHVGFEPEQGEEGKQGL